MLEMGGNPDTAGTVGEAEKWTRNQLMKNQFEDIQFPGWEIVRKLGEGSFGGVYEIQRTLPDGRVERGALKRLSVPRDREEIEEMLSNSFSTESITAHYKDQMGDLVREYSLMQELGNCGNVVTCHDIQYVQQEGGLGWDVYIRMELLRPLKKVLGQEYREETVLKLGLDLCNALKACQKKNIIHRDIKPENILVSEDGTFKLTDFGIAKVSEKTGSGTLAGTNGYMAPEVANRQHYGASADQYSLGMVLYWMMNKRTLPFLPLPPEIPAANQRQDATNRRFNGEPLPPPVHGSSELKQIVQKACAFSPAHRYQSIHEFSAALEACCDVQTAETNEETVQPEEIPPAAKAPTVSTDEVDKDTISLKGLLLDTQPEIVQEILAKPKKSSTKQRNQSVGRLKTEGGCDVTAKKKNGKTVLVAAVAVAVVLGGIFWGMGKPARDYKKAQALMDAGQYNQAQTAFEALGSYQDSAQKAKDAQKKQEENQSAYQQAQALMDFGQYPGAAIAFSKLGDYQDSEERAQEARGKQQIASRIAGYNHTVGLRRDGTVVTVGNNTLGQCAVSDWTDIRTPYWNSDADSEEAVAPKSATNHSQTLQPGQNVTMGHYPKASDSITWQVLDVQGDKALLIAQKGLDVQPYNTKYGSVTWETSSLRDWLNTTFLNGAFTDEEQKAIRTTYVDNGKAQGCDLWDTDGGNNTQDKVFLLSYGEAKKYFDIATPGINGPEKARIQPTMYAVDQGAYVSEEFETSDGKDATRWWLRSPGCVQLDAACVHSRGCVGEQMCSNKDTCVRPAMWVDLDKIK